MRSVDEFVCDPLLVNDTSFIQLPANLPVPQDDGACAHLVGRPLPDIALVSTSGNHINLRRRQGLSVLYVYPITGRPGVPLPVGWDEIPGARGCTPESCAFRDHHAEIRQRGAEVFGLSTQSTDYQREVRERLHLTFDLLRGRDVALRRPRPAIAGRNEASSHEASWLRGRPGDSGLPSIRPSPDADVPAGRPYPGETGGAARCSFRTQFRGTASCR